MVLLNEKYASGAMFTAGGSGANIGISGINDITGRMNFGLFNFPQTQEMEYTTNAAGNLTAAFISGPNQNYDVIGSYNVEENPIEIIFSGTTIGSTIKQVFWYQTNGSLATSTGSLISGTMAVY